MGAEGPSLTPGRLGRPGINKAAAASCVHETSCRRRKRGLMIVYTVLSRNLKYALPLAVANAIALSACGGNGQTSAPPAGGSAALSDTALVTNKMAVVATPTTIDANLSNPWGLATGPG